jgi:1,4-dihydroxy-2-naphthoate octaprenyltransferase
MTCMRFNRRTTEPVQTWERVLAVVAVVLAVVLAVQGDWVWAVLIGALCVVALVLFIVGRRPERRER